MGQSSDSSRDKAADSAGSQTITVQSLAEAIVANVRLPLLVLSADHRVTSVNASFLDHFRLSADETVGRPLGELSGGQWDTPELAELLQEAQRRPGQIAERELEQGFGPVGRRTLLVTARRLDGAYLAAESLLLGIEDVTEKRRAEQVLRGDRDALMIRVRHHEDALAQTQASLNAEIIAHNLTREQLLHANRLTTVGKLTAGLAHEMGTPINVVTARGQMILRGQSSGDQVRDDVQIMVEQADRVAQIVRELLDYSRQRPVCRPVPDLRALSERLLQLLSPAARRKEVVLELDPQSESLATQADAGEVRQVLTNLIINAVDAQESGGKVSIQIGVARAVGPLGPTEWAAVRVSDEGPGIPQDSLDRVFEPFFTTKDPGEGTGLGLAVSESLAAKHGGWITVENLPHKGARFVVYLPLGETHQ